MTRMLVLMLLDLPNLAIVVHQFIRPPGHSPIPVVAWLFYMYACVFTYDQPFLVNREPAIMFKGIDVLVLTAYHVTVVWGLPYIRERLVGTTHPER